MIRTSTTLALLFGCAVYAPADDNDSLSFADDIAPIIYENCVVCHNPDGVGPFSLIEYDEVRKRGRSIADVVTSGYMPPWKPETGYGPHLLNTRGLDDLEVSNIRRWVASGRQAGDLSKMPPVPEFPKGWALGEPDLVLGLSEPYTLPAVGKDIYRNFVIPVEMAESRFVKAVDFLPQTRVAIHHGGIFMDAGSWARQRDAEDAIPGFESMNLSGLSNPEDGIFIGWTPGSIAYEAYPGTQWRLSQKVDFVVQLHMLPTGKPEKISPKIGIYFTDTPPTKLSTFILLSSRQIDIPAGEANYTLRESIRLPMESHILGVYPHAHYLGKDIKIYADLPDGGRQGIIWIPDWDFNWQSDYRLKEPLTLPSGSTVVMEYTYDNSAENLRNPFNPPRRVGLGFMSTDEMGEAAVYMFVDSPEDLEKLDGARIDYSIEQEGGLAPYLFRLALDHQAAGNFDEAEKMLRASLQEIDEQPKVYNSLGMLLENLARFDEVEDLFRAALRHDPAFLEAKLNLARFLFRRKGDDRVALGLTDEILHESPHEFQASILQSNILDEQGRPSSALKVLTECAEVNPEESYPLLLIGQMHLFRGDLNKAHAPLEHAANGAFENLLSSKYAKDAVIRASAHYSLALIAQQRNDIPGFKQSLQGTLLHDPKHPDGLLFSSALAYLERDASGARSFMERLLSLSAEKVPPYPHILSLMPFPNGPEMIVEIHLQADRKAEAGRVIAAAVAIARQQNRSDWAGQFARLAKANDL
jgi:tetratricopeptide (TPR) repeat protein